MAKSMTRGRAAAAVAGGAALLLGTVALPAGAASHDVSYRLVDGTVRVGAQEYSLPAATGVTGTWDDVTGDFVGTFVSEPTQSAQDITSPLAGTIHLTYEFQGVGDVTGNVDPGTGTGTLDSLLNVVIYLDRLETAADPIDLDVTCTIPNVAVSYDVTATGLGAESEIFTDIVLSAAGFSVPTAGCVDGAVAGAAGLVEGSINDLLALPSEDTDAEITLEAGAVPPPTPTTTRAPVPSTTSTTAAAGTPGAADPARPVAASPRYTG